MTKDGQTLTLSLRRYRDLQKRAFDAAARSGEEWAELKRQYAVELARAAARLHDSGVPAAMVSVQAKGDPDVAALGLKVDTARERQKHQRDLGFVYKDRADQIEAQIQREWHR